MGVSLGGRVGVMGQKVSEGERLENGNLKRVKNKKPRNNWGFFVS